MTGQSVTRELNQQEAGEALRSAINRLQGNRTPEWRLDIEVLGEMERLAFRAMQILVGRLDQHTLQSIPEVAQRRIRLACRGFAHSMHPTHQDLALRIACQERTREGAIVRYLECLEIPLADLVHLPVKAMPTVEVLWKCGECGRLYAQNIDQCTSGHLAQDVFPVEAKGRS